MPKTIPRKSNKPSVSIIGAGRLGQALALALQSAGYPILALVARRRQKAEKAAVLLDKTKPRPLALGANQLLELPESDLTIISTPRRRHRRDCQQIGEFPSRRAAENGFAHQRRALFRSLGSSGSGRISDRLNTSARFHQRAGFGSRGFARRFLLPRRNQKSQTPRGSHCR